MKFSNEVNVKNFHVLDNNHKASVKVTNNGEAYILVKDGDGNTLYSTDKFRLSDVKYGHISVPSVPSFKKWSITIPATPAPPHTLYTVYMHFTNLYGYGITDRWEKYATITMKNAWVTPNTSSSTGYKWATGGQAEFANALAKQINAQYIKGMKPIEATISNYTCYKLVTKDKATAEETTTYEYHDSAPSNVAYSANTTDGKTYTALGPVILLTDATFDQQKKNINRRALEKGFEPQPIEMYISTNILEYADPNNPEKTIVEDESWCKEVADAASNEIEGTLAPRQYNGEVDDSKVLKNAYLIWMMEKISALNSFETMPCGCDGFLGYDTVMDNTSLEPDTNYCVLDIHYETLPKAGMPANRNLKDLSFAAPNWNTLAAILNVLADNGAKVINKLPVKQGNDNTKVETSVSGVVTTYTPPNNDNSSSGS